MVDHDGEPSTSTDGTAPADERRRHERAALDGIEAALVEVADALARMG